MSSNKKDKPQTANQNHARNKPEKGRMFVRTSGGSVLLTQTKKLFGTFISPRNGA